MLSVKSKNGLNAASTAGSAPVLDFDLHGSIGYYLADSVVLSFDYEYTSTDGVAYNIRPQNNMGLGGIINQMSIYSLQDGVLLEEIQDAHILNSLLMSHNNGSDQDVQDGTFKRMSVTECYTNDFQEITPFVSPNAQPANPIVSNTGNATYQSQKIQLPLRLSSLLNSDQVIPLGALGGLRIRLQLNPPSVFNMLHGDDVDGNVVALPSAAELFEIVGKSIIFGDYFIYQTVNNIFEGTVAGGAVVPSYMTMGNYADLAALVVEINTQLTAMGQSVTCAVDGAQPTTRIVFTSTNAADVTLSGTFITKMVTGTPPAPGADLVILANTSSVALVVKQLGYTMPDFIGGADALALHLNTSLATLLNNGTNDIAFTAPVWNAITELWTGTVDQTRGGVPEIVMGGTIVTDPDSLFSGGLTIPADADPPNNVVMTTRGRSQTNAELVLLHDSFYVNNPKSLNTCPFKIGTVLEAFNTAGASLATTPAITEMAVVAAGIKLTFASDLDEAILTSSTKVTMKTKIADETVIQYSMKNIALEVPVITPPPSYVLALQKAMNSAEGMKLDMKGYQLVRSNVQAGTTLASMNLPFVATRAKGIVSIPHVVGATNFTSRNVANNLDFLKISQYNYEYFGIKHPARSIDCNKARLGSLSQELIAEQHKSYDYCMPHKLLSFDGYKNLYKDKTFFLGRNLAIHNTTFNTINSNLNLTIESTSTDGGAANAYNVNHYVSAVHSLVLRPEGVTLEK